MFSTRKKLITLVFSVVLLTSAAFARNPFVVPNHNPTQNPTSVPEPATIAMAGVGLVGVMGAIRRKFSR